MAMLRGFIGKFVLSLLCLLVLSGCTQKIDGSSKEAYEASVAKLTKDMTDEQKLAFRKAIGHIGIESLKLYDLFRKPPTDPEELKKALQPGQAFRDMVNGKTVEEVLTMGEDAKSKQAVRQKAVREQRAAAGLPPPGLPAGVKGPGASTVLKQPSGAAAGPKVPLGNLVAPGSKPAPAGSAPAQGASAPTQEASAQTSPAPQS
jgi:uncharacterized lipoprotein